jgi:Protein of unknown function (DUF2933)
MERQHEHPREDDPTPCPITAPSFWRTKYGFGLVVFGAVALYFLLTEHRAHFFSALPFLLLLACPLMHVFMHHGHGDHHQHRGSGQPSSTPEKPDQTKQGSPP